ncbi:MAG: hypothetical protein UHJ46_10345 [Treponema sp.]|nr:hypothetical protein [Treponema sp.]
MTETIFDNALSKRWGIDTDCFLVDIESGNRISGKIWDKEMEQNVSEMKVPAPLLEKLSIEIPSGIIWVLKINSKSWNKYGELNLKRFDSDNSGDKTKFNLLKTESLSGNIESAIELFKNLAITFFTKYEIEKIDFKDISLGTIYFEIAKLLNDDELRYQFIQAGARQGNLNCQECLSKTYKETN